MTYTGFVEISNFVTLLISDISRNSCVMYRYFCNNTFDAFKQVPFNRV